MCSPTTYSCFVLLDVYIKILINLNFPFILQSSLQSEKERADDLERKHAASEEFGEEKRQKLEETEKKVEQLQQSLKGYIFLDLV